MSFPREIYEVFDREDAQALESFGLLTHSSTIRGMVRASKRRLRKSSSEGSNASYIPSRYTSSSIAAIPEISTAADVKIDVPSHQNTLEYFLWLGFNLGTAQKLFNSYCNARASTSSERPEHIIDTAKAHIKKANVNGAPMWTAALQYLGIDNELTALFLDSRYQCIRGTASLEYWLLETCDLRQRALEDISELSTRRKNQRKKKTPGKKGCKQEVELDTLKTGEPVSPEVMSLPKEPPLKSGHVLLWKGLDIARTNGLLSDSGELADLNPLLSDPPGDFSGTSKMLYFTQQKNIAELFAQWAMARVDTKACNVCLVAMQVPSNTIGNMTKEQLY